MTINEMVKEMEVRNRRLSEIAREFKFKNKEKYEVLKTQQKHTNEWAFHLTQRVITNYKKAQIEKWWRQSKVALGRAERLYEVYKAGK
jgi:membrane-bound lytic murein transglycosylase B